MILILGALLIVVALGSWGVAFAAGMAIMKLVPKSERWKAWVDLGWWRLDHLVQLAGPEVAPHQKRYVMAWTVFFAAVVLAGALGALVYFTSENGVAEIAMTNSIPLLPTGSQET